MGAFPRRRQQGPFSRGAWVPSRIDFDLACAGPPRETPLKSAFSGDLIALDCGQTHAVGANCAEKRVAHSQNAHSQNAHAQDAHLRASGAGRPCGRTRLVSAISHASRDFPRRGFRQGPVSVMRKACFVRRRLYPEMRGPLSETSPSLEAARR
ncbi:hypothetical protein M885DRAFT_32916 [Pelagophyceae sp. CCMP2097]|nr:hypothetical protein M885DRAFT_32916 [Pelagophyceae sp. CCMP2097]|mmetsp:Transcript_8283/g.29323  ORF Transcript_8283/g.29323 Transcript_8283/m.29323 type:complete len:153 (+) Transcript_8283:133-591(+)